MGNRMRFGCNVQGLLITARVGVQQKAEWPDGALALADHPAPFDLKDIAPVARDAPVQPHAIGVAACVRRIVPGAVIHGSPAHKLRPWIMAVAVVIEKIRGAKATDD